KVMEDAVDWIEKYSYDPKMKAFGRYYAHEIPLTNSWDYGWDNSLGKPTETVPVKFNEQVITRSYDLYINSLMYATYHMLSAMQYGEKSREYTYKASQLEPFIKSLFKENELPGYGVLLTDKGQYIKAGPYGLSKEDYTWALALPNFYPEGIDITAVKQLLLDDLMVDMENKHLPSTFSFLASLDVLNFKEDTIMKLVDHATEKCYEPNEFLPLKNTMVKVTGAGPDNPENDIRQSTATFGAWMGTMANLGIKKLPYGIAARPTDFIDSINNYQYKNGLLNIHYKGSGNISKVTLNGQELMYTWQVPEGWLRNGNNNLEVIMKDDVTPPKNTLIRSTIQLMSVNIIQGKTEYVIRCYGKNNLEFKNLEKKVVVYDGKNARVNANQENKNDISTITFQGKGFYKLILE
ncbi:MAG: hypothetical protein ACOCWG_03295, partial [bacterium]